MPRKGVNRLVQKVKVPWFYAVDLTWEEETSLNLIFVLQEVSLFSEYVNLHI